MSAGSTPVAQASVALNRREKLLGRVPAFAALPLAARHALASVMREERYEPGSPVVIEGSPADRLYLICVGTADASRLEQNRPVHLQTLHPGAVFGELALVSRANTRLVTVTAATPLQLLSLRVQDFEELSGMYPGIMHVFEAHARSGRFERFLHAHLLYHLHFTDPRRERLFLSSISFFLTFVVVRVLVTSIRAGRGPFHNVQAGGTHIHHLVWGILLLLLVGYLWLIQVGTGRDDRHWMRLTAVLYGIGAALTLDEFALWLQLADVYFSPQGTKSVQAVLLFGSLLSVGVWGGPFFRALFHFLVRRHPEHMTA